MECLKCGRGRCICYGSTHTSPDKGAEAERAAFEAWRVRKGYSTNKWHDGGYVDSNTQNGWEVWQAARRAPAPVADGLPPLPDPHAKVIDHDNAGGTSTVDAWIELYDGLYTAEQVEQIRRDAIAADRQARASVPAAGAVQQPVGSIEDYSQFHNLLSEWMSARDYWQDDSAAPVLEKWQKFIVYIDALLARNHQFGRVAASADYQAEIAKLRAQLARQSQGMPVELVGIRETMAEGGGFWTSCSGCHDTEDGHPTGPYSYSQIMGCALGSGCSECGGIGAVWDNTDYEAMYSDQDEGDGAAPAPGNTAQPVEQVGEQPQIPSGFLLVGPGEIRGDLDAFNRKQMRAAERLGNALWAQNHSATKGATDGAKGGEHA